MKMNTDRFQTLMGLFEAIVIGLVDYFVHVAADGFHWKSPTFWGGILLAISRAVKSYFAAGTKSEEVKPS